MGRKPRKDRPPKDRILPAASPRAENRYAAPAVCGFLLLAVALVFGSTVGYGFVNFDDNDYVYDNPHLARGLSAEGVAWAFTTTYCGNWHPLTWLSYLLDYQLYGLAPWGYHLTNVLLHAAATIVLFLVLRRMTGDLWPSAFAAAVFAIHPLRAESVAWVAERKDVLSGLFFMLTLAAYASYVRRPFSLARYLAVIVLFALGLMAKPMLVTLPLVLLLLDYWPLGRMMLRWRLVVEKLPLLALSAASCVVTPLAQGEAVIELDLVPLSARIVNAMVSYAAYLSQLFCPLRLAAFYPYPPGGLPSGEVAGAIVLLSVITVGAVVGWRRWPWLPVGWFWYLGMLVPVIGLVQTGGQSMADRYTYLPEIGVVIALAWAAKRVFWGWPQRGWVCGVLSALTIIAFSAYARQQTSYWRTSAALWSHALECSTLPNALAHYNLGLARFRDGRLDEAIADYREALKIKPDYVEAQVNLGVALCERGQAAEAIVHYRRALEIKPDYVAAYNNLGVALLGQGHVAEAIVQHEKALEIEPDDAPSHYNLGVALQHQGRAAQAIAQFEKALELKPNYAEAHNNIGWLLDAAGRGDEAIAEYQKALEINPNNAEARTNLGTSRARAGRIDEAIALYQRALESNPALVNAHQDLAIAFFQCGRMAEAIGEWREVIGLQPDNVFALNQLARMLATTPERSVRDGQQAVEFAKQAVALNGGRDADLLDTLAAAQAEAGRFAEAVETAQRALDLASGQNNAVLGDALRARIKLYQERSPYRESGPPSASHSDHP